VVQRRLAVDAAFTNEREGSLHLGQCFLALERGFVLIHLGRDERIRVGQVSCDVEVDDAFEGTTGTDHRFERRPNLFCALGPDLDLESHDDHARILTAERGAASTGPR
jgi:hypothetical protein